MSETRPKTIAQVAQYALNGWAIYATRKIEHDDIALLWSELKAMLERSEPAAASVQAAELRTTEQIEDAEADRIIEAMAAIECLDLRLDDGDGCDSADPVDWLRGMFEASKTRAIEAALAAPAVSREASVPQGGEFRLWLEGALRTAEARPESSWDRGYLTALRHAITEYDIAHQRALSSAPGEREGR
jgi:hypothetical protein